MRELLKTLVIATASLALAAGRLSTGLAAQSVSRSHVPGKPWAGTAGITETIAQIMAREAQSGNPIPKSRPAEARPRLISEPAVQADPLSPLVSQWPVAPPSGFRLVPGLFSPQVVGTSFLGTQLSESGSIPPDSMGAVGPSQIVVISNGRIKLFTKTGVGGILNTTTDSFFTSVRAGSGTSDPHIRYDRLSGRWFVVMITVASHSNRILIAVSSGSTITNASSFTFFQFPEDFDGGDAGLFADYPTLGVDTFALYIGANMFTSGSGVIANRTGFVVNKASLLAGGPIVVTAFRGLSDDGLGNGMRSPQGVDNDDPAATEGYFIGVDTFNSGLLDMRRISDPGGTPSISGSLVLTVPATARPIPQAHRLDSLGKKLDALDDRLFSAAIHQNKLTGSNTLWTAHNLEVDTNGVATAGGGRNGSRWYEIGELTNSPTLIQAGTLFDPAVTSFFPRGYWMPSVAMSGQGHMALGCSYAAVNAFAGVATAGRLRTDALGSTQPATLALISSTAYNLAESGAVHRWGDFSQTVVDPADDMTMWTFQEYCNAANSWGVRVVQLKAPPPAIPATATPTNLTAGQSSVDIVITGTSASGSEFFDPGADVGGPGYANHIGAAINGGGVTINSVTFSNPTNITINVNVSPSALAGDRTITVTNPDGRSATSASTLVTILAPPTISAPPQSQAVAQGSNATFSVAASGTPPLNYQWRFNQVEILAATANSYTRTNVQCADAGNYDVVITNSLGSVTSSVAILTVVAPPAITVQPTNQTVFAGQSASFMVTATNQCGGGLAYQWQLNGINIAAATTSSYTRSSVQPADAGSYTVAVTTLAGSVTSAVATLTVMAPPSLLSPTLSGGNFSFSFATVAGFTYLAQYKNSLSDPVWQTLQSIPGDGTAKTITVPLSAAAQRFYRVAVQ